MAKTAKPKKQSKTSLAKSAKKTAPASKTKSTKASTAAATTGAHRFAHPFFTTVPKNKRKTVQGVGTSLSAFAATKLEQIPAPLRDPTMTLAQIIGQVGSGAIEAAKSITFHAVGDTGTFGTAIQ